MSNSTLLSVRGLSITVNYGSDEVVHDVSFELQRGQSIGIVGESGSGKSLTCRSVLGILPPGCALSDGSVTFDGIDLGALDEKSWRKLHGSRIAAVFQDPASYLNPSIPVGKQLAEVLRIRGGLSRRAAATAAVAGFASVGLRNPAEVYHQYPFELSGGMLQRVLIAISVSCNPDLLIADEPTTALDVTVQADVLDLLADLRESTGLSLVLVSHDLAVIAQVCDTVIVMKDGRVVESGPTKTVLSSPQHEYTKLLVRNAVSSAVVEPAYV